MVSKSKYAYIPLLFAANADHFRALTTSWQLGAAAVILWLIRTVRAEAVGSNIIHVILF